MLPLFEQSAPAFRTGLATALGGLARENVFVGTSSWKYEGWMGQIYTPERYLVHGKLSKRRFEGDCLAEYAETFPIVCGDFSFYQFPSESYWRRLFGSAPATLRFAFKVPEEITRKSFPMQDRYGPRAGSANQSFLNAELLDRMFLEPLRPFRAQIPVLIFEFGAFSRQDYAHLREFLESLDRFLAALPADFRYFVEVRNPALLVDEYFNCLRGRGAAHVFSAWTRMPELGAQLVIPQAVTADFTVCRALLRHSRSYESAVRMFSPYEKVLDPNPEARQAIRRLIGRARADKRPAFLFVNNRLEGNAPATIWGVVGETEEL